MRSYNFGLFAIFCQKIIIVGRNFTKLWQNNFASFFETRCIACMYVLCLKQRSDGIVFVVYWSFHDTIAAFFVTRRYRQFQNSCRSPRVRGIGTRSALEALSVVRFSWLRACMRSINQRFTYLLAYYLYVSRVKTRHRVVTMLLVFGRRSTYRRRRQHSQRMEV